MKIQFPEYGNKNIDEGCHDIGKHEMKFAVLKVVNETAKKILIIFPSKLGHKATVSKWIGKNSNIKFLGAGRADIPKQIADWGSTSCSRPVPEGGFGKEKPEEPAEADKLLAQVREKVKELAKNLQEV